MFNKLPGEGAAQGAAPLGRFTDLKYQFSTLAQPSKPCRKVVTCIDTCSQPGEAAMNTKK